MILPETMVAKMRNQKESEEEEPISIEQLKSIQASMEQQQMKLDVIQEEEEEEKENVPVQNVIVQPMIEQPAVGLPSSVAMAPSSVAMAPSSVPMMPIMEPSFVQQGGMQMGGMNFNPVGHIPLIPPVTGAGQEGIMKSTLPHGPSSTIIVGTDQDDFMRDGIGMGGFGLPPRAPRRSFRPSMGNTMGPMMPSSPNPMAGLPASGVPFTITKLE
jgi:hypothetical protein